MTVTDVGGDVEVQAPRGDVTVADVKTDTGSGRTGGRRRATSRSKT